MLKVRELYIRYPEFHKPHLTHQQGLPRMLHLSSCCCLALADIGSSIVLHHTCMLLHIRSKSSSSLSPCLLFVVLQSKTKVFIQNKHFIYFCLLHMQMIGPSPLEPSLARRRLPWSRDSSISTSVRCSCQHLAQRPMSSTSLE